MAKAKKLPSGRWRIQVYDYTDENGKIYRKSFTAETKKEAEFLAAEYSVKKSEKRLPKNKTVGECIDSYINHRQNTLALSTVREYEQSRKRSPAPLMNLKVGELSDELLQKHFDDYAVNHSPKSCRNLYGLISAALKAFDRQLIFFIKLPQKKPPQVTIPTQNDIKAILDYVKGSEMELPVLLGALAGLRRSEICALTYEDFDLKNNTVKINKALVLNKDNRWVIKNTKTVSSNRTIQISQQIIDLVKKRQAASLPLLTINPSRITDSFSDILTRCGVAHFRFHDLRHYNASVMLALGVPDKYAMARMGHSTSNMLKTVYQHLIDEKEKEVNDSINDFFNNFV